MTPSDQPDETLTTLLGESRRIELVTRTRAAIVVGTVVVLLFWVLDWVMQPAFLWRFAVIRLVIVGGFMAGAVATTRSPSLRTAVLISQFVVLVAVGGVSAMHALIGPSGQYFYGVLMAVFVAAVFMPWRTTEMVVFVAITLAVFLSVQLVASPELSLASTFLPAFFLVGTGVLAVVAARVTTRLRESDERSRLQLERQNRDLESLARQKDRFFSNVSHELRTPLTLILAPIDRLIATHQDQASQDLLRAMSANARRLLRQVNALLDLSKADAGRLRLDLASGNIGALVERLTGAARPYAEQKGITLTLEGAEWAPTSTFDHDKIDIIIANLLSNALKFTPRGGSVSVAIRSTPDDVVVEVRDTGHGIPVEDHAKIFERFHQVDDSEVRAHEGTGLGLALALDLTNLHGGSLKLVESSPAGSLFRATIPRAPRDQGEERRRRVRRKDDKMALAHLEDQTAAQLERVSAIGTLFADLRTPAAAMMLPGVTPKQDIRVLLVEDNSDLRAFVAGQLAPYYHVTAVADGELGLASARAERPDVVITDAMMPKVDGVTLCRTLRADKSFDSTALIMLTARIGVDAVEQGLAAGADDYITKPFELRELLARVDAQVRARRMERSLLERDTRLVAIGTMTSGVVHDIRNGLAGVLAYADMARNKEGGGEFARELDAIVRLGTRLNRALQDILDFARGSDVSLRPSFAVPRTFGTEVGQSVRSSFEHAHISFEVQFDGEVDSIVSIDTDRMHRALENLLLNARDACLGRDERRVRLAIAVRDNKLSFVVDDSGSGIADDVAPRLFTTFATSGKRGGNGLGLATVRNIVRAHGGDIEAVPHGPLGGARFAMWLPVQPAS